MGKHAPSRPFFADSIALLMQHDVEIIARCPTCNGWKPNVDLDAIERAKGYDYCLWNRTTKCTLTPGCRGKVYFRYRREIGDYSMRD